MGGGFSAIALIAGVATFVSLRQRSRRTASRQETRGHVSPDDTTAMVPSEAIQSIGDYQLIAKIGQGGMGTVYRAVHRHLGRVVALKIVNPQRTFDADALTRFRREVRAVGRLDHPGVVRATDAGEVRGVHYLVMDYVDGMDMGSMIRQAGPLPTSQACEVIRQIAGALQYVHSQGLVHRDIKPSNIILAREGTVKLLDLGLARLQDDTCTGDAATQTGQVMGTPDFMAPEQAAGGDNVDARADIYGLGCTFYALLAGHGPFGDAGHATPGSKAIAHMQEAVPSIRTVRSEVSEQVAAVLERMLAKSPNDRFQEAKDVAQALEPMTADADLSGLPVPFPVRDFG
jgi:serine/threonine protein kinase